jgi:hypothetical protein
METRDDVLFQVFRLPKSTCFRPKASPNLKEGSFRILSHDHDVNYVKVKKSDIPLIA